MAAPTKRDTSAARAARAAKRAESGETPRPAKRGGVGVLVLVVAGLVLLYITLRSVGGSMVQNLRGLSLWTGGTGWRIRPGQYIDTAAAKSLRTVGEALTMCETSPMTLDVSRAGGGVFPPHKSHQAGRDVDIRMSDLSQTCRTELQAQLVSKGWRIWYDGPDAVAPVKDGRHISHLHARYEP